MRKLTIMLVGTIVFLANPFQISENCLQAKTYPTVSKEITQKPYTTTHVFVAKLTETKYRLCLGETALCPHKCGNSGEFANFKVVKNNNLIVNGEARKEKMSTYLVQISDYSKKNLKNNYSQKIRALKVGDLVKVNVDFVYDITKSSVRTVEKIRSITKI